MAGFFRIGLGASDSPSPGMRVSARLDVGSLGMEGSERLTGDEELKARIELALVHVKKIRDDARQVIQSLAQIRDDLDEQQGD